MLKRKLIKSLRNEIRELDLEVRDLRNALISAKVLEYDSPFHFMSLQPGEAIMQVPEKVALLAGKLNVEFYTIRHDVPRELQIRRIPAPTKKKG